MNLLVRAEERDDTLLVPVDRADDPRQQDEDDHEREDDTYDDERVIHGIPSGARCSITTTGGSNCTRGCDSFRRARVPVMRVSRGPSNDRHGDAFPVDDTNLGTFGDRDGGAS